MTWEALAAIAGLAAFVMSAVALWRQHRSDQRQQRLDRRLVEIEEARHAAEIDQSRTADVIVTGTRHHSVSGSHYRLTLHNHGGGEAREVTVAAVYAVAQGLDITRHRAVEAGGAGPHLGHIWATCGRKIRGIDAD